MSYTLSSGIKAVLLSAALTASAVAIAATPVEQQKARHEHYEELGDAFKAVRDQTKKSPPDWAVLNKAAETVQKASVNQQQWFAKGTGPEAGKTRALPVIWEKTADFEAAQKMLAEKAPLLASAVKSKDIDAVKKAFGDVGGACKNCHDTFRAPEE